MNPKTDFPGTILPGQIDAGASRESGERRLAAAVLDRALQDFLGATSAVSGEDRERLRAEAAAWLLDADESRLFSSRVICEALGLNPDAAQEALRAWERNGLGVTRPLRNQLRRANPTAG